MGTPEQTSRSDRAIGYFLTLLQAAFYSSMGVFARLLYADGLDPSQVMLVRFTVTVVLLGAFMLVWRKEPLLSRKWPVYAQSVFFFLSAWWFFLGVERLGAGLGTMLFLLYPLAVALINAVLFRERLSVYTVIALGLALAGMVLVSGALVPGAIVLDPLGIFFALAGGVAFAAYTVLIQKVGRSEGTFTVTFTVSLVNMIGSFIVFAPLVPTMVSFTAYQWGIGAAIALLNTIVPVVVFIFAIQRIGATEASLVGLSEMLFSLALSHIVLGESISTLQAVGIVAILAGLVLVTIGPSLARKRAST